MADCSATSSCTKLQPSTSTTTSLNPKLVATCTKLQPKMIISKVDILIPRNVILRSQRRDCLLFRNSDQIPYLSPSNFYVVQAPILFCGKRSRGLNGNLSKSNCWGTLVDPENTTPENIVSAMDQVLLMVSAIFAYMAGVVPQRRSLGFIRDPIKEDLGSTSSTSDGRSEIIESKSGLKTNAIWSEVNRKLLDALDATSNGANLDDRAAVIEDDSKKHALSLFALNQGPIWRLLWAALRRLQKEVCYIQSHEAVNRSTWLILVSEVFKGIIIQICTKWLEEELSLCGGGFNMNLIVQLSEKLKGKDMILNNIKRSGKTELYADLLYFLKFGSLRCGCCLDTNFLVKHGVEVLEDLVITLADAVACIYLDLISMDCDLSMEINFLGLMICPLSTRVLQRLRNEVVLKQWLQQNFESVVSLYEDRFDLFVLYSQKIDDELESQTKRSIWEKLIFRKQSAPSTRNCVQIIAISLTAKRTRELQALTGWRYYFSLFLEFSDVAMPLLKAVFDKARNAVSFFLMCMIGRSVGLIFSGIRQSLGWK